MEDIDAEVGSYAATLRLVAKALNDNEQVGPWLAAIAEEARGIGELLASAIEQLHATGGGWQAQRRGLAECSGALKRLAHTLYFLADGAPLAGHDGGLAVGWLGQQALELAQELAGAVETFADDPPATEAAWPGRAKARRFDRRAFCAASRPEEGAVAAGV